MLWNAKVSWNVKMPEIKKRTLRHFCFSNTSTPSSSYVQQCCRSGRNSYWVLFLFVHPPIVVPQCVPAHIIVPLHIMLPSTTFDAMSTVNMTIIVGTMSIINMMSFITRWSSSTQLVKVNMMSTINMMSIMNTALSTQWAWYCWVLSTQWASSNNDHPYWGSFTSKCADASFYFFCSRCSPNTLLIPLCFVGHSCKQGRENMAPTDHFHLHRGGGQFQEG